MTKIVSVHSFRGGTGKSNITANLAAALAAGGSRIAVVDTDIQSPGIHALFNLDASKVQHSLNDYLWGRCPIEDTAYDVSAVLRSARVNQGQIFLVASSLRLGEIARILRDGYDVDMLNDGLQDLIERLQLDYLLIDTHPGINEETLLSLTISDLLLIILRPDRQDFQGTAVTVEVARRLQVPNLLLVVNRVLPVYDAEALEKQVTTTYNAPVAGLLPNSDDMMQLASSEIFYLRFPHHPLSQVITTIAKRVADAR